MAQFAVLDSACILMPKGTTSLLSRRVATVACALFLAIPLATTCSAQLTGGQIVPKATPDAQLQPSNENGRDSASPAPQLRIGPGDELDISVYDVPELTQHVRVENTGDISLPLVERIHVAGLSSEQAQEVIERALENGGFIKNPHVAVFVKEYTNGGIVVQGQVNRPGVYPAYGQRRLSDVLLQAGGPTQTAADKVSIVRPGQTSPIIFRMSDSDVGKSAEFAVLPGDTVNVAKAGIVYVLGEVTRPGGFVLQSSEDGGRPALSAIQAMALASGPTRTASLNKARIIRRTPKGIEQISLPLKKIMDVKGADPQLEADDILFIPNSRTKAMAEQAPGSLLAVLASAAIYRF